MIKYSQLLVGYLWLLNSCVDNNERDQFIRDMIDYDDLNIRETFLLCDIKFELNCKEYKH